MDLSDNKKRKLGNKYDSGTLFLETYNYDHWFKIEELADTPRWRIEELNDTPRQSDKEKSVDLCDMPPPASDVEVKEKWLKIFIGNKLLTRLSILLTQIKAEKKFL